MKEIKVTAQDIARAFNRNKKFLMATESTFCDGYHGVKSLIVQNEHVMLRQILEYFNFPQEEIDRHLHTS